MVRLNEAPGEAPANALLSAKDKASCDPVTLEVIRGAIRAAQAEMEALIERTAISAFIREKKDFYTSLFDADGVMAVGSNMPVFGDMAGSGLQRLPPPHLESGGPHW